MRSLWDDLQLLGDLLWKVLQPQEGISTCSEPMHRTLSTVGACVEQGFGPRTVLAAILSPTYWGRSEGNLAQAYQTSSSVRSVERESVRTSYPSSDLGLPSHGSDGGPDTSYRAGPSLLNHATRQSTFERRFRPLETNFSESKPCLGLTPRRGVVVLALALQWTSGQTTFEYFSPWFCFKFRFCTISRAWPVGVIGVSRQALAGSIRH